MTDRDPLPGAGWAERLAATGRVAATAARLGVRRLARKGEDATDAALGEALAGELDRMKGMAMKAGQILSYFDGVLPAGTHEALRVLQRGAVRMPFATVRERVEGALGAPLAGLFETFEEEPAAAASIGQVHRAVHRGAAVAVKVQYPGVCETMQADFGRLDVVSRLATLATAVRGPELVRELRERVRLECDYRAEAAAQDAFREAFADDPQVTIPGTVPERSAGTVLTTDWVEGWGFYELAADATPYERDHAARVLLRFAHRSVFELETANVDPHPGNYLFPGDGTVAFLDFGCVRRFDPAFVEDERRIARVVLDGRRSDFRRAVLDAGRVPDERGFDWELHWDMLRHQYAPYLEGSFRFTADYVRRAMEMSGPLNPNLRKLTFPPEWVWLQRLHWGLHAALARLEAGGEFGSILRRWLDGERRPLELPAAEGERPAATPRGNP